MKVCKFKEVFIAQDRQRREIDPAYITDLAVSIERNRLINLPVLRRDPLKGLVLVAGEQRMRAIETLWMTGGTLRYGAQTFAEGELPYNDVEELDQLDAYEMELEENRRRRNLTWQEEANATSQLLELRRLQASRTGAPEPTVKDIAAEIRGTSGGAQDETRKELIVARHLNDPDVAKASSTQEAFKVIKRKEELQRSAELARVVGTTYSASTAFTLQKGDCLTLGVGFAEAFDCILTDPPYGINAQDFSNSDGKTGQGSSGDHFYDDSPEKFFELMGQFAPLSFRMAKPQAHLYLFCDIEHYLYLRSEFTLAGWKVHRTPLVWINPSSQRAPWPDQGPQRKFQLCLYAVKGSKPTLKVSPDAVTYQSDENLNHPAQKPVALYKDFLSRSCRPGDTVADPFCGSGTVFPAAHELKLKAWGCELDGAAFGIAVERIGKLK
jgi:DNA modification methylase/ParB-like chromosome segregation protein Spo0J